MHARLIPLSSERTTRDLGRTGQPRKRSHARVPRHQRPGRRRSPTQQRQPGQEMELDVDAHDGHQAVRVVVVGFEAARDLERQRDRDAASAAPGRAAARRPRRRRAPRRRRRRPRCSPRSRLAARTGRGASACPAWASPRRSGISLTYRIRATSRATGIDAANGSQDNAPRVWTTYAPTSMNGPNPSATAISPSPR